MNTETREISLRDRDKIEELRRTCCHVSASHAFASLYIWRVDMGLSICLGEDAFAVKYRLRGDNSWFFPCGKPEAVREFISAMLEHSEPLRLSYVRDEDADFLRREFPGRFQIAEVPGDSEYIYDRAGQVSLDGGRFVRLRNDIHRIERGHELCWEPVGPGRGVETARAVCRSWAHPMASPEGLRDARACDCLFDNWLELEARGVIVYVDGEPMSVTAGYPLSEEIFDLSLSKQSRRLSGLSVYSRHALIRSLPEEYQLLNGEEDLGIAGLRQMKELMRPVSMIKMYEGRA